MTFHSFLEKSIVLLFFASVFFGLVAVCTPTTANDTSDLINSISSDKPDNSGGRKCRYNSSKCEKILVRKEWYTLTDKEKQEYLDAVVCLSKTPSLPTLHCKFPGTVHRLDDFAAVHSSQTPFIHFVGFFLQWHRYFVYVYEKALRQECNYTGAQPYWNLAKDIARDTNMSDWGIFSNKLGFGGNGPFVSHEGAPNPFNVKDPTGGGCVPEGRFGEGSYLTHLGPTPNTSINNPRCLIRDFAPSGLVRGTQEKVNELLALKKYTSFDKDVTAINFPINTGVHGCGHIVVGGILGHMDDLFNSPGDPLFFMHHANLDRIYWQWQLQDPKRLCEIGGPTVPNDYSLKQGGEVTLDYPVDIDIMGPRIPVGELLDTSVAPWCYKYKLDD